MKLKFVIEVSVRKKVNDGKKSNRYLGEPRENV